MAQNPSDDFVDTIKNTFQKPIQSAVDTVSKVGDWVTGKSTPTTASTPAAKQDTSWHDDMVKKATQSFGAKAGADDKTSSTTSSKPTPKPAPKAAPPKYHQGTDYVPKTGPAILKKGEAVLNKDDAQDYRESKGKNMNTKNAMKSASDELGGKKESTKKEIHHIKTRKGKSGGYIHTHVHTKPEEHPDEEHVSPDQDSMVEHMMQHMGEPNPGEAEADAGQSGVPGAAAGAPAPQAPPSAGM